ncbi:MAG: SDR family NAD(P)-dependent oxidoreductase [bacterium]
MFHLHDKVAIVTGAGSGIGQATAMLFAKQGALVAVLEINEQAGKKTVEEIKRNGGKASCFVCDVADREQVLETFDAVVGQLGKIDILVNNAGISHVGNVLTTSAEDFERVYRVNVRGVYNCLQAGVAKMVEQGGGVILNMASIASKIGLSDRFAYSMSKGAVLTMTRSVAKDFIDKNIRCNCVCPARIHTPFVDGYLEKHYPGREQEVYDQLARYQPIGRMGRPEEVAALALYLCSDEAAFVTGAAYEFDGGVCSLI